MRPGCRRVSEHDSGGASMGAEGKEGKIGIHVQDGKLPRHGRQDEEQGETDNKADHRRQIAGPEYHQAIPPAYYRVAGSC